MTFAIIRDSNSDKISVLGDLTIHLDTRFSPLAVGERLLETSRFVGEKAVFCFNEGSNGLHYTELGVTVCEEIEDT
ncbi:MAG: hypothetical protein RMZ41_002290 [Nostoc sp. DedVER02]|uniref:hypothetical protein n=1 Tax=unclassified Nostoc TaxID=2593658 RepID=UPI002AD2FF52|nr:hypothetical protein [Nostoc sp. DedVER02]MDZ7987012.1 hypothetical protein [Nostoc sp. DedVER02]